MKALIMSLIFTLAPPSFSASESFGGDGHGGDPLRAVFKEGRDLAIAKVANLKWCSFNSSDSDSTVNWLLDHKDQLINELQESPHVWISDIQDTCAFTRTVPGSSIYLSFPACREIIGNNVELAAELLLHEVTHHLGVSIEGEADLLANTVINSQDINQCPSNPDSPFDRNSCTGEKMEFDDALEFFPPGSGISPLVTTAVVHQRVRACNFMTGCEEWTEVSRPYLHRQLFREPHKKYLPREVDFKFAITRSNDGDINFFSDNANVRIACNGIRSDSLNCFKFKIDSSSTPYFVPPEPFYFQQNAFNYSGDLRKNCFKFKANSVSRETSSGSHHEMELVILGSF